MSLVKILALQLIVACCITSSIAEAGRVSVRGYFRKDGTYVQGYTRSSPSGGGGSVGTGGSTTYVTAQTTAFGARAVTISSLNLRQSASTASRIVKQLPRGSLVDITSCTGGWCRVNYGPNYGFVAQNFLQVVTSRPPQTISGGGGSSVYYSKCADARAAGAAPLFRGQPGYRSALDRDSDGIACE